MKGVQNDFFINESVYMPFFIFSVLKENFWVLLSIVWISFFPNLATLQSFFMAGSHHGWLLGIYFLLTGFLVTCFLNSILLLLAVILFDGVLLRIVLACLLLIAVIIGFNAWNTGMYFDKIMLANVIQTNSRESIELLSWKLFAWIVFGALIPSWLLYFKKFKKLSTKLLSNDFNQKSYSLLRIVGSNFIGVGKFSRIMIVLIFTLLLGLVACLFIFARYAQASSSVRNHQISFHTITPVNFFAAAISYAYAVTDPPIRQAIGLDAVMKKQAGKPRLVFFLLGETARAKNHGVNGYHRETTPNMQAIDGIYFPNTLACGTSTAISVPCIFSGIKQRDFTIGDARHRDNLLDLLQRVGVKVLWRDNDDGCKGVCDRVKAEMSYALPQDKNCLETGDCFDEVLLQGLEDQLQHATGNTVVFLHLKGSHGPAYYKRYPKAFEFFKPACPSNDLASCDVHAVINSYDNSIRYADHVVGLSQQILNKLSNQYDVALVYVSDHGESLGENGLFLHGVPYSIAPNEQKLVPLYMWLSKGFQKQLGLNMACLGEFRRTRQAKHEDLYSTLLGMLNIQTSVYDPKRDLLLACQTSDLSLE